MFKQASNIIITKNDSVYTQQTVISKLLSKLTSTIDIKHDDFVGLYPESLLNQHLYDCAIKPFWPDVSSNLADYSCNWKPPGRTVG